MRATVKTILGPTVLWGAHCMSGHPSLHFCVALMPQPNPTPEPVVALLITPQLLLTRTGNAWDGEVGIAL